MEAPLGAAIVWKHYPVDCRFVTPATKPQPPGVRFRFRRRYLSLSWDSFDQPWCIGGLGVIETPTNPHAPRVLWVDDQWEAGMVLLLELEGFAVDCATTVATGLSMACARAYDGIVLDQCLPDGSGLMVLEKLRSEGVPTPVMLLTGFGDIKWAVTAMRLGALDYKQKPLVGDEWVDSLRGLVSGLKPSSTASALVRDPPAPARVDGPAPDDVARLLGALREASSTGAAGRLPTVGLLARAVSNPALGVSAYVGCAEALRRALTGSVGGAELAAEAHAILTHALLRLNVERHARLVAAFDNIRAALASGRRPSSEDVARQVDVTVANLELLLDFDTGRNFTEWRCLLAIQLGAQRLAASAEQVAQIAYMLGFEHAAQFNREFHRTLGLTPTDFRRLLDS
jgi:ActR/RegA family two-component response regulator/AraC-like DNA-binding protein